MSTKEYKEYMENIIEEYIDKKDDLITKEFLLKMWEYEESGFETSVLEIIMLLDKKSETIELLQFAKEEITTESYIGIAAIDLGKVELAEKVLLRASAIEPENEVICQLLAECYIKQGELNKAIDILKKIKIPSDQIRNTINALEGRMKVK